MLTRSLPSRLGLLLTLGLLSACSTCPRTPETPAGPRLLTRRFADLVIHNSDYKQGGPAAGDLVAQALETPVVDIHGHTFNARYLPIRNILLGKRDVNPLAIFLYDGWARRIASAVVGATTLTDIHSGATRPDEASGFQQRCEQSLGPNLTLEDARDNACVRELEVVSGVVEEGYREIQDRLDVELLPLRSKLQQALLQQAADAPDLTTQQEDELRSRIADLRRQEVYLLEAARESRLDLLEIVLDERLHKGPLDDIAKALGKLGFFLDTPAVREFLISLIAPDGDVEGRFQRSFEGQVSLLVSHTMDLEPVYAKPTYKRAEGDDDPVLLPFENQLERMQHFQSQPDSHMLYFVAFNPFREHERAGRALEIVRHAIEKQGAYGVKVYPPSGYRPHGNVLPGRPMALFTKTPGRQWDERYRAFPDGRKIDELMDELFAYCSSKDIPVFTHCLDGEFEARKGYADCMADPRWWRPVLEKYPKLRLCFGHAGHPGFWFGTHRKHTNEGWGRLVYELCVTYENVYCEFGVHAEALDRRRREYFIALVSRLIAQPKGEYPIEHKLLYGSDWYMPTGLENPIDYLHAYQATFTDRRLIQHYRGFFLDNALTYLDAAQRTEDQLLPVRVRDNLTTLLAYPQR